MENVIENIEKISHCRTKVTLIQTISIARKSLFYEHFTMPN